MIPLFIPYLNRPDLLQKAVESTRGSRVQVTVFNNSDGDVSSDHAIVYTPLVPLTFSQTQNAFLKMAGKSKIHLFMHSDAQCSPEVIDSLICMAESDIDEGKKIGAWFTNYDALCAYNTEAMKEIGGWDTMLSWYLSDCDYYRRLRLAGYSTVESGLSVTHIPSQTLNFDSTVKRNVELEFAFRQNYYRHKWGGDNEHETFTVPFNASPAL